MHDNVYYVKLIEQKETAPGLGSGFDEMAGLHPANAHVIRT
jgi:hypothetical protein